jgi:hypothetical protein
MYSRYSPVWRRDFENATIYCNPYQEYISFDCGWLSPEDGLIDMHVVPSSVDIDVLPEGTPVRAFDRDDSHITYQVMIDNPSENAALASVWANLTRGGSTYVSSSQVRYLVGAQDTSVKDRVLRLPPTLSPGTYCLEVMVGGPGFNEIARDTITLTKVIDLEKRQHKHDADGAPGTITVFPHPAVASGEDLSVRVDPGASSGRICSVRLYDVSGRLIVKVFEEKVSDVVSLDVDPAGRQGAPLAPGVYFLSVDFEDRALTKKIVVLAR